MQLEELLKDIVDYSINFDCDVRGLALNSNKIKPNEAFLAIKGHKTDGRHFILDAIKKKASVVLAEAHAINRFVDFDKTTVPIIPIVDLNKKVGILAERFYQTSLNAPITVGVTGTNGKSTCCFLLTQALTRLGLNAGLIGTLGYGFPNQSLHTLDNTTPDAVSLHQVYQDLKEDEAKVLAMEVSSHGLDQYRVVGLPFQSAIFTNLSQDHLDYHKDMKAYLEAKKLLFKFPTLQRAIINLNDSSRASVMEVVPEEVKIYLYSLSIPKLTRRHYPAGTEFIYAKKYELTNHGIHAYVVTPWGEGELRSPLLGDFNLSNLLAVLTELCCQGHPLNKVLNALSNLTGAPGRMQRVRRGDLPEVIVDYAHTPDALDKALMAARQHCKRRLWCVFGCGGGRDKEKRQLMGEIAVKHADKIIITNDNPRNEKPDLIIKDILSGIDVEDHHKVIVEKDRKNAIYQAVTRALAVDTILIAGKGHESTQDLGYEKVAFNDMQCVEDIFAKGTL